ncbi:MAG: DMT family transporter [Steroidobacteraceae bacterium]
MSPVAIALVLVYLIWGSSPLATKVLVMDEPALLVSGLRFTIAGLFMGALAWWRHGPPRLDWDDLRQVLLMGTGSILISNGCNALGFQHVASNVGALLNATPALMIAALGTLGPRASPLDRSALAGLLLGVVGVALVLDPFGDDGSTSELAWSGVILIGCLGWSVATIYYRNIHTHNPPETFLAMQMLTGGLGLLAWSQASGEPFDTDWTREATTAFLWLTVMSTCVGYTAYNYLVRQSTPVIAGSFGYVIPGVAALLGWLVLDERLSAAQIAGMAVILLSTALVTGYANRWLNRRRVTRPG